MNSNSHARKKLDHTVLTGTREVKTWPKMFGLNKCGWETVVNITR